MLTLLRNDDVLIVTVLNIAVLFIAEYILMYIVYVVFCKIFYLIINKRNNYKLYR